MKSVNAADLDDTKISTRGVEIWRYAIAAMLANVVQLRVREIRVNGATCSLACWLKCPTPNMCSSTAPVADVKSLLWDLTNG